MKKYYLTYYEEYPIFEPAEGGYYYAGQNYDAYWEYDSLEEAKQQLLEMKDNLEEDGFVVYDDCAYLYSKYIGNGSKWFIEETLGENTKGWHPYC